MKISVIMPVYNTEKYLEKSINSILEQTFQDFELIIVNDASTDRSLEVINKIAQNNNKIKVIDLKENLRQGGARNKGIDIATGKYIYFMDSDDWIAPNFLEEFYTVAEEDNADIVGTDYYYRAYADGNIVIESSHSEDNNKFLEELKGVELDKEYRNQLLFRVGGVCNNLFKKSILDEYNIRFPEKLSYEDNYFVTLYLMHVKKYSCINKPYYYYRQNLSSTLYRTDKTQLQRIKVEELLYNEICSRGLFDYFKEGYKIVAIKRWFGNTLPVIIAYEEFPDRYIKGFSTDIIKKFGDFKNNKYYRNETSFSEKLKIQLALKNPKLLIKIYKLKWSVK